MCGESWHGSLTHRPSSHLLCVCLVVWFGGGRAGWLWVLSYFHGPAVNVVDTICEMLPRLPSQTEMVPLKLKRKVVYRGHMYRLTHGFRRYTGNFPVYV